MESVDERRDWVERVLGVRLDVEDAAALERTFRALHETAVQDFATLRRGDAQAAEPIAALLAQAETQAASAAWQDGVATLREATGLLAQAAGAARARSADAAIADGTVSARVLAFEQAAQMWDRATQAAISGSGAFRRELEQSHPAEATAFERILDSYADDLSHAIEDARGRGAAEDPRPSLIQAMERLRQEMQGDALLTHLDRNGIAVRAAFGVAMDSIAQILRADAGGPPARSKGEMHS